MLGILQNDDTTRLDDCCSCAFTRHPEDGDVGGRGGGVGGGSERQARKRLYGTNRDETQGYA